MRPVSTCYWSYFLGNVFTIETIWIQFFCNYSLPISIKIYKNETITFIYP